MKAIEQQTEAFPGQFEMIASLDQAVAAGGPDAVTRGVRSELFRLMRTGCVELPEEFYRPVESHYARRLLYLSPEHGYSVIGMTWGPGQGTPLHDHGGMWCVEAIWSGSLEVVQYELIEVEGDRYHFEPRGCIQANVGSAGSLIPPHEYHTMSNMTEDGVAVSVHIYSGKMMRCNTFKSGGGSGPWYSREEKQLGLD